jgi:hypothetical protein
VLQRMTHMLTADECSDAVKMQQLAALKEDWFKYVYPPPHTHRFPSLWLALFTMQGALTTLILFAVARAARPRSSSSSRGCTPTPQTRPPYRIS